jgi:hypothetical protein
VDNREVDALVAEKIMRLNVLGFMDVFPDFDSTNREEVPYDDISKCSYRRRAAVYMEQCRCEFRQPDDAVYFGHGAACLEVVRQYTRDLVEALNAAEKLELTITLYRNLWANGEWYWHCHIGGAINAHVPGWAEEKTAPLAICVALLRHRGIEVQVD